MILNVVSEEAAAVLLGLMAAEISLESVCSAADGAV